jgi:hypothetical protein
MACKYSHLDLIQCVWSRFFDKKPRTGAGLILNFRKNPYLRSSKICGNKSEPD